MLDNLRVILIKFIYLICVNLIVRKEIYLILVITSLFTLIFISLEQTFAVSVLSEAYPGYDQQFRPLIGGVQIQTRIIYFTYSTCSLGVPIYFKNVWGGISKGFITAGHCGDISYFVDQPSSFFIFNQIGVISRDSIPGTGSGDYPIDAAIIDIGTTDFKPFIYENGLGSDPNHQVGIYTYEIPPSYMRDNINFIFFKSGRTTGLTFGWLTDVDVKKCVTNYCVLHSMQITKKYQVYSGPIALPGDSGSPVYRKILIDSSGNQYAIVSGILFGGDRDKTFIATLALRIWNVWQDVTFYTCGYGSMCY